MTIVSSPNFDHIHIVMVGITHPGNIGAAARAMMNMGLSKLVLVEPKKFPDKQAVDRASGATGILDNASVCGSLEEAIADCRLVFGCSARDRSITWPTFSPRLAAEQIQKQALPTAIVFGREHSGLTNEELDLCHYLLQIPTNPKFASLNVASAVQVICYELRQTSLQHGASELPATTVISDDDPVVSAENLQRFYTHLEQTLIDVQFLDPEKPRHTMRRLQRLFNRQMVLESEMNILRGVLTAVQKKIKP